MDKLKLALIIITVVAIAVIVQMVYDPETISQLTGSAHNRQAGDGGDRKPQPTECTPAWECKEYDNHCRGNGARSETITFQNAQERNLPGPAMRFTARSEDLASIGTTLQADNVKYVLVDKNGKVVLRTDGNALRTRRPDITLKTGEEYRLYPATQEDRVALNNLCGDPSQCGYTVEYGRRTAPAQVACVELRDRNRCNQLPPEDLGPYAKECNICAPAWECAAFSTVCTATPGTTTFTFEAQTGTIYDNPSSLWGAAPDVAPTNAIKTVTIGYTEAGGAFQPLPAQFDTMTWQWIWYYETLLGAGEEAAVTTGSTAQDVPMTQGTWYIVRAYDPADELVAFCGAPGRSCQFNVEFDTTRYAEYTECTAVRDANRCGSAYEGDPSEFNTAGSCSG